MRQSKKRSASDWFSIDGVVKQGCIISPWLLNEYIDTMMKEVRIGMRRMGVKFIEEGRDWRLPTLWYTYD